MKRDKIRNVECFLLCRFMRRRMTGDLEGHSRRSIVKTWRVWRKLLLYYPTMTALKNEDERWTSSNHFKFMLLSSIFLLCWLAKYAMQPWRVGKLSLVAASVGWKVLVGSFHSIINWGKLYVAVKRNRKSPCYSERAKRENYRMFFLFCHIYKQFTRVIINRLTRLSDKWDRESKLGSDEASVR